MTSKNLRLIILVVLLACTGIIATQMFWVRQAYALENRAFHSKVLAALRDATAGIARLQGTQPMVYSPVRQMAEDLFAIEPNTQVDETVLQHYLATAFYQHDVITDFQYAQYDCSNNRFAFQHYYHMPNSGEEQDAEAAEIPPLKCEGSYIAVHFPHRHQALQTRLSIWTASSVALLVIIGFLGYLLIVIFRQKMLSEVRKDFVANMTHEFQTPLASIHLAANVLKNPKIADQPHRLLNYATIIANESAALTAQVQRVLQVNATDARAVELNSAGFVWQELINEALEAFIAKYPDAAESVHLHLPDEPVYGHGDELHLKNVIFNLLDNALKYTRRAPDVRVSLRLKDGAPCISVMDNGEGIAPAHQKLLFQKFYRVPTGNVHDVKGFGLGLNYVWLLMRAHGGSVSLHSVPGKGSTFTLAFPPAAKKHHDHHERANQSKHPAGRR